MPVITTYKCDNCGHTQDNSEDMFELSLSMRPKTYTYSPSKLFDVLWCKKCIAKTQLGMWKPKEQDKAPISPSIEDLIREIAEQAVVDSHG